VTAASGKRVERSLFGRLADGTAVDAITLANASGMTVRFITYGGAIVSLIVPDRDGKREDVVLGYDSLREYVNGPWYFGSIVGRYANRIGGSRFMIGADEYHVSPNEGPNHLHGGARGFHRVNWSAIEFETDAAVGATLSYMSPAGEEGYPGSLACSVRYILGTENELAIEYEATTSAATPVNLTQHSYFNLDGHGCGDILDHELTIAASRYTPVDASLIPTGELRDVSGSPFDFRQARAIGDRINADDEQLRIGAGYDHNFVLDGYRPTDTAPAFAARVADPRSGRVLDVYTTEPGVQLYTSNGFNDAVEGKEWRVYLRYAGLALETQHFPDSPNQPAFPSAILFPGETYRSRTIYRFSTREQEWND
jgi:aldose 1-epimerase